MGLKTHGLNVIEVFTVYFLFLFLKKKRKSNTNSYQNTRCYDFNPSGKLLTWLNPSLQMLVHLGHCVFASLCLTVDYGPCG